MQGPIAVDTLLTLDPDTGEIIGSWGSHFFYMPHGLTIDKYGYYYMTDVALHQVIITLAVRHVVWANCYRLNFYFHFYKAYTRRKLLSLVSLLM